MERTFVYGPIGAVLLLHKQIGGYQGDTVVGKGQFAGAGKAMESFHLLV